MKIQSVQRFAPFTHQRGVKLLIPNSSFAAVIYPTYLDFTHFKRTSKGFIRFAHSAPFKHVTVQLDLERGCVIVWGESDRSYFRYHLFASEDRLYFYPQKGDLQFSIEGDDVELCKVRPVIPIRSLERLSLGVHKKQEWPLMFQRAEPQEIVPFLYALGQWTDQILPSSLNQGALSLVPSLVPPDFESHFQDFFRLAFHTDGLFYPTLKDEGGWGFHLPPVEESTHSFHLAAYLYQSLRSLLFISQERQMHFLPHLPKSFHCGRLINLQTPEAQVDIEWSKKVIRRVVIRARRDAEVSLHFRHVKTMRVRHSRTERGAQMDVNNSLKLKEGSVYFLDNFQK